jgi:hypothetical protein
MGALSSIMDIGHASGPLVTGIVITAAGYATGFLICFLVALRVTIVFLHQSGTGLYEKKVNIYRLNVVINSVFSSV